MYKYQHFLQLFIVKFLAHKVQNYTWFFQLYDLYFVII